MELVPEETPQRRGSLVNQILNGLAIFSAVPITREIRRYVQEIANAIVDRERDRAIEAIQNVVDYVVEFEPQAQRVLREGFGEFLNEFFAGSQTIAARHQSTLPDSITLRNLPDSTQSTPPAIMEASTSNDGAKSARLAVSSTASSGGNKGNRETPVYYHKPTYGLRETHTAILPVTFYFSAANMDKQTPLIFKFRTNHYRQVLQCSTFTSTPLAANGIAAEAQRTLQKSFYNICQTSAASGVLPTTPGPVPQSYTGPLFPKTFTSGSSTIIPAYANYYEDIFEYFTVMNCNYEVAIQNVMTQSNNDLVISYHQESQGPSGTSGILPFVATYHDCLLLPQVQWKHIGARTEDANGPDTVVLRGNIGPGEARRDVVNDEDVKTWTKIGEQPSLEENMRIQFWAAPGNGQYPLANFTGTGYTPTKCNISVTLKYTVQFKDLAPQARWPTAGHVSSLVQTYPADIQQSFSNITP